MEQTQTVKRKKIQLPEIMPRAQGRAVAQLLKGEEGEWFRAKLDELLAIANAIPRSYETDGQGSRATARLHYFTGGCDWWITELDADTDGEGQAQAFGMADIGSGPEVGYISLVELCESRAEIDLHWTPATLAEIKARKG
jgi:hypothetical protein